MTAFLLIYLLVGPAVVLAVWIWLRSRREPVSLIEPMEIGRVIGGSFGAFSGLGWPMLVLAVVVVGVPHIVWAYLNETVILPSFRSGAITPLRWAAYSYAMGFVLRMIDAVFVIPAILQLVAQHEGQPTSTRSAMFELPWLFPVVILLGALQLLGIAAGIIFFIVPGILLLLSWGVAQAVLIIERPGLIVALRRSRELTIGSRGRIAMALIIFALIVILASAPTWAASRLLPGLFWIPAIYGAIVSIAAVVMSVGFNASLCVELRRIRDGMTAPGLAEVFA